MTKGQLKDQYNAPKPENFVYEQDYLAAKTVWVAANPDKYQEILAAPPE